MKALFVADGSPEIGTGHIVRCLSLLMKLRKRGHACHWVLKETTPSLVDQIRCAASEVMCISGVFSHDEMWEFVLSCVQDQEIDFVVSDHYSTTLRHFEAVLRTGTRLLIIDDVADRQYAGNLLVNQNSDSIALYQGRTTRMDRFMLGPKFALLKPEFADLEECPLYRDQARRILLTMGGADRHNLTLEVLQAILPISGGWAIDVALGPCYSHVKSLRPLAEKAAQTVVLHQGMTSLLPLMRTAGLMICAAGSTVWEGCRTGLPMVLIQSADNQRLVVDRVVRSRAAVFLGRRETVSEAAIRDACLGVMRDVQERRRLSFACRGLVDGRGAERVVLEMEQFFRED